MNLKKKNTSHLNTSQFFNKPDLQQCFYRNGKISKNTQKTFHILNQDNADISIS